MGNGYQEKYKRPINIRGDVQIHLQLKKKVNFKRWDTTLNNQINKDWKEVLPILRGNKQLRTHYICEHVNVQKFHVVYSLLSKFHF